MGGAGGHELTPREAAVLAAVERRLTNAEIAAEMFISLRTVESHIAALRRKLDVDSRAGLISAAWRRRGSGVPVPANSFVGREHDVAAVRALLIDHRFVSVVGVGGCGKTRLALEIAASDARVPVVAELEHATSVDVVAAVARAIGIGPDAGPDLVAACGLALEGQRYLLVLDNCDRVTEAVATLVRALLAAAPALIVLATSRSPVGGDVVHPLAPLAVDEPGSPAVRLFLDRAGAARPAGAVALATRICRRLDGLPLAIELAAARARHLPLDELADLLDAGLGSLDQAGPVGRHRTLHTAFAWTWDLLDDDEQAGLLRVAALPEAFDLATAAAVGVPDGVVLRLLDRSLLVPAAPRSGPQHFRLLAPMRAFVLDRTEFALPHDVRLLHARHASAQVALLRARARTDDSAAAVEAWRRLAPDACSALEWAVQRYDPLAVELAAGVSVMVQQYGADRRSLDLLARAARDSTLLALGDATMLFEMGMALTYGDLTAMDLVARELLGRTGDDHARMLAHELAGFADGYLDRPDSALTHLAAAEGLAERLGETWHVGSVRQARGIVLRRAPETLAAAVDALEASMSAYVTAGDAAHVNNVRYMIASVLALLGERTEQALFLADECLGYARANGNRHELAHAQLTLAMLGAPGADAGLAQAIDAFRAVGDLRCLTRSCLLLAGRRPLNEQVTLLEQTLDVAVVAGDRGHQASVLERLAAARWRAGAHRSAAVAVGNLARLVGREAALDRLPGLRAELEPWATAVAEGEARGPRPLA